MRGAFCQSSKGAPGAALRRDRVELVERKVTTPVPEALAVVQIEAPREELARGLAAVSFLRP